MAVVAAVLAPRISCRASCVAAMASSMAAEIARALCRPDFSEGRSAVSGGMWVSRSTAKRVLRSEGMLETSGTHMALASV